MRRNLRFPIVAAVAIVAIGVLSSCSPEQVALWRSLGPDPVTAETMTPEQRAIVAAVQEQQRNAAAPVDCYTAMERVWPSHLWATGRKIIHRESRNNPAAQNPVSSAAGCWQTLRMHAHRFDAVGCSWAQRYDAMCNTRAAYHLYQAAGGWSPWRLTAY